MSKQMVDSERLNSTQKTNAVTLRKQKDELEKENALIKEDLRRKEDELSHRLESDATAKRKVCVLMLDKKRFFYTSVNECD
jgi:hypothetical protein